MQRMRASTDTATAAAPGKVVPLRPAAAGAAPDDDAALMLAYAGGDMNAFEQLYARHERAVFRFILRSLPDPARAEEILQETWIAVVRHAQTYEPRAKFTTWLYGIARNKLIDVLRAQRDVVSLDAEAANDDDDARPLVDEPAADAQWQPDVQALSRAQAQAYLQAVGALPASQREAFLLHAEGGLTLDEIAQLTGAGHETVKSRLRYAMNKLRTALEQWR